MTKEICPLGRSVEMFPQQAALEAPGIRLTYRDLDDRVRSAAEEMRAQGIHAGQRVGIRGEKSWIFIVRLWALFRLRAVACLLSTRWPESAVGDAAKAVGLKTILTTHDLRRPVESNPKLSSEPTIDLDEMATIVFSSGSTARPKAIAHNLRAHWANAEGSNQNLSLMPQDRWLLALPLFHVSGLGVMFRCFLSGATVVIPETSQPIASAASDLGISHLSVVPTQLKRLRQSIAHPPRHLRAILLGGSGWPIDWVRSAVRDDWPIFTTYGLSEMASQVTTTAADVDPMQIGSAGKPLAGREIAISQRGEILVRGSTLFQGYVRGDQIDPAVDNQGWFHTGDRGQIDEAGNLWVQGRFDNLFISGGENLYPEEIEARLLEIADVREAIVVPIPDDLFGHRPVAFVDATELRPNAWRTQLARHLPDFKLPDHFLPWPSDESGIKANRSEFAKIARRLCCQE